MGPIPSCLENGLLYRLDMLVDMFPCPGCGSLQIHFRNRWCRSEGVVCSQLVGEGPQGSGADSRHIVSISPK